MIVYAILLWLGKKLNMTIGKELFYERIPIDNVGNPTCNGIVATEVQAPYVLGQQHCNVSIYGVCTVSPDINVAPTRLRIDRMLTAVENAIDSYPDDNYTGILTIPQSKTIPAMTFRQVQMQRISGKNTLPDLANGAAVKTIQLNVFYQIDK